MTVNETNLTRNLGILYEEESGKGLTHPFFVLILDAFKEASKARGYEITFINVPAGGGRASLIEHCRWRNVDGVCMVCCDFASPGVRALAASGLPCVTVDHIFKHVPAVLSDNETGVQKLVEYAISKGHRRIAFIHGHNNSMVTRTRIDQFVNTMAYYDLRIPEGFVCEGLYHDIGLTRDKVYGLLSRPDRPTCILLPDDMTFFGAQDAARKLRLSIPEDVSFAGYDGIPLTQSLSPRLTTIRQNCGSIGHFAAQQLIDLIEHPETASHRPVIFPVELIEGGTVASCRP